MRRNTVLVGLIVLVLATPFGAAADRVPGDRWLRFVEPAEAGFDVDKLEAAREVWEGLPSAAFVVVTAAVATAADGERKRARTLLAMIETEQGVRIDVGRALVDLVGGKNSKAGKAVRKLATDEPRDVEAVVNLHGYGLLQGGKPELALAAFELNTRVFPEAFNAWDSLGEAHMVLGHDEDAIRCYRRSLELNADNENAEAMIVRIQEGATAEE